MSSALRSGAFTILKLSRVCAQPGTRCNPEALGGMVPRQFGLYRQPRVEQSILCLSLAHAIEQKKKKNAGAQTEKERKALQKRSASRSAA